MAEKKTQKRTIYRDEKTGKFVSKKIAEEHPTRTKKEIQERGKK